jgi:hypothetical protein
MSAVIDKMKKLLYNINTNRKIVKECYIMVEKNKETEYKYIKTMLEKDLFAVVYPKDKSEKSAEKMVEMIDSAIGLAEFKDEDGNPTWGVLIDKIEEAKKHVKLDPPTDEATAESEAIE